MKDRFLLLERADEDFREAVSALTKITPLNAIDPKHKDVHFYILHKGEVHEAHYNRKTGKTTGPTESPHLGPEMFSNQGFLKMFKDGKGNANAYMIENLSEEVPVSFLVGQGMIHSLSSSICDLFTGEGDEKQASTEKAPPQGGS